MASSPCLGNSERLDTTPEGGDRPKKRRIKASRGGRWPDDTAAELLGPVSFSTGAGSFLLSRAEGGQREDGRAAASVLAQVRCCSS